MPIVEVFADVSCPFAHVGLRRLVERRHEVDRPDVILRVLAWPLELVNGASLTGEAVAEKVAVLRGGPATDLFGGLRPDRFPTTTLPALRLTSAAVRRDDVTGEAVALELRDRLFERGQDVSDPDVLRGVAEAHGLAPLEAEPAPDPVRAEWAEGRRRHVVGSPHFFVGDADLFCPSLSIRHAEGRLVVDADPDRFEELAALCFR
jgi:predicted DsbA family dithiol-disulfide isomerase